MKKIITLILICTIGYYANAQEFSTYVINNVGRITIPDNMELQSGNYKKMMDNLNREILQIDNSNRVTFQVKGTNNLERQAVNSFARIIIDQPRAESYANFRAALQECNDFRDAMQQQLTAHGGRLVRWNGCSLRRINGVECIVISYHRQDRNFPHAVVNMYLFYKNGKVYTVTMSYRHTEESIWKPLFERTLSSFVIN
jgi:hypothetical protein